MRIVRFPIQTLLGAQPGLGMQPHYDAPIDIQVEIVKTQFCPLENSSKLAMRQLKSSLKNTKNCNLLGKQDLVTFTRQQCECSGG